MLISCKSKTDQVELPTDDAVEIPEDFLAFYAQFHQDADFQMNHIVFPLSGKSDTSKWQKNNWTMHKPIDLMNGEYVHDIENFAGILTESIIAKDGYFYIIRRFAKTQNEWNLIYYTQGTKLDGFEEVQ